MAYADDLQNKVILPFAELYEFYISTNEILYFTSYYKDIVFNSNTYKAITMQRDVVKSSLNPTEVNINLTIHITEDISEKLLNNLLTPFRVSIIRYFVDTQSFKYIFQGYASTVSVSHNLLSLKLDGLIGINNKTVPVIHYQGQCNNSLFDSRCGIDKLSYMITIEIGQLTKVSDTEFTSDLFATKPDGYFTNGVLQANDDFRLIVNHIGNTINIQYPFDFDITTTKVYAYAGCNKTIDDCRNKFNNEQNFLGFPYIPTSNPVIWGIK